MYKRERIYKFIRNSDQKTIYVGKTSTRYHIECNRNFKFFIEHGNNVHIKELKDTYVNFQIRYNKERIFEYSNIQKEYNIEKYYENIIHQLNDLKLQEYSYNNMCAHFFIFTNNIDQELDRFYKDYTIDICHNIDEYMDNMYAERYFIYKENSYKIFGGLNIQTGGKLGSKNITSIEIFNKWKIDNPYLIKSFEYDNVIEGYNYFKSKISKK